MSDLPTTIPTSIANLLVAYFCHTATSEQRDQLDEWICENEGNMRVFEECLESSLLPVTFDPDRAEEFDVVHRMNLN
jgi:hypothetical protein